MVKVLLPCEEPHMSVAAPDQVSVWTEFLSREDPFGVLKASAAQITVKRARTPTISAKLTSAEDRSPIEANALVTSATMAAQKIMGLLPG
jgi:hypothetical protein